MASDKSKIHFLNGTDYLSKTGWQRAEMGDVCNVGTGPKDVLSRTAEWLCKANAAEWVIEADKGKETKDNAKSG